MTSLALIWDLIARDGASPVFTRVAASADKAAVSTGRASKSVAGFGKGALKALGAVGAIELGVKITKDAAAFQKAMTLIQTNAGASAKEVRAFSKALLSMSGKVATAPEDLATSLYHVYSVGLRGAKALNVVKIAAEGAKVGNADLEETTNALTSTVASGIKGVNNMSQAMGQLTAIVGAGDMKLSDLNDALGTGILAAARGFNVSLTQVGAALATFGDNNIRGADAATKLRMVMQDLAKPAANADEILGKIHLTTDQLKNSLAKGGLTTALDLLKAKLVAAGISAKRVGPFLEDAFTKKAGVGLAILINQMGRFHQKLDEVARGGKRFGSDWEATQKTASFVFSRIGHELEAIAITTATKVLPGITDAAAKIESGFKKAGAALRPVADGLGKISGLLTNFALGVAGVYVATKAFTALQTAIVLTRVRMLELSSTFKFSALGLGTSLSAVALAGPSFTGGQIDAIKQLVAQYKGATGAVNTNAKAVIAWAATTENAVIPVKKVIDDLHLSTNALAAGVSGSDDAYQQFIANLQQTRSVSDTDRQVLDKLHQAYANTAIQVNKTSKSFTDNSFAAKNVTRAAQKLAGSFISAKQAADELDAALKRLSGLLTKREALDQYRQSVQQLKSQLDKHTHTLEGNTVAAVKNRLAFDGVISNALAYGQTLKDQGAKAPAVRDALVSQFKGLIANAHQYGETSGAVRDYLATLHLLPKDIRTRLNAIDLATPKVNALKNSLSSLHDKTVTINTDIITNRLPGGSVGAHAQAAGTRAAFGTSTIPPNTRFTVGERGWEGGVSDSRGRVSIFSNSQSRAMGFRAPTGYANGTGGITHVGKDYIYAGIRYASLRAARNAQTRAQQSSQTQVLSYGSHTERSSFNSVKDAQQALNQAVRMLTHQLHMLGGGELDRFRKAISKTGSDVKSAFSTIRDSLKQIGASSDAIHRLTALDNKLAHKVDIRNRDLDRLHGLINQQRQLEGSVRGAARGAFDVTTAGTGPSGSGKPTGRTILAQALQDKNIVKKWAAGIRKLAPIFSKSATGKAMLARFATSDPATVLPQIMALEATNPAQLRRIIGTQAEIGSIGRSVGALVGGDVLGSRIAAERRVVRQDRHEVAHLERVLVHAVDRIADRPIHVDLSVDGKKIATAVATGNRKNGRRS